MRFFAHCLRGAVAFAIVAALATPSGAARWDAPVATVNGEAITRDELAHFLLQVQGEDWLRAVALREAVKQEAEEHGVKIAPEEIEKRVSADVEARLNALAESRGISLDELEQELMAMGQSLDAVRESLKNERRRVAEAEMLPEKLLRREIAVTDDEVRSAYDEQYGPKVRVRHIETASIGDAMEILQALDRGAEFDRLAEDRTLDRPSRQRNFELLPSPTPSSAIGRRATALEPGRKAIVREGNRFHVIELIEYVEGKGKDFEEVAEDIRERIVEERLRERRRSAVSDILERRVERLDAFAESQGWDTVVAQIGPVAVRRGELADELIARFGDAAVSALIMHRVFRQEAERKGVSVDEARLREDAEEQVESGLRAMASAAGLDSLDAYAERLQQRGTTLDARRRSLMAEALPHSRSRRLGKKCLMLEMEVSEEDIRREFHRRYDAKVRARQIVTRQREEAEQAQRILERGASFAELARQGSIDGASARHGGVFEVRKEGTLGETLAGMDAGERRIVPVGRFYHLVEKLEDIPARNKRYSEVRDEIEKDLLRARARRELDHWGADLISRAQIDILLD